MEGALGRIKTHALKIKIQGEKQSICANWFKTALAL